MKVKAELVRNGSFTRGAEHNYCGLCHERLVNEAMTEGKAESETPD